LADALVSSRVELADRISANTGVSYMLVRSFITPLESAIRCFDHQPIIEWLRVVKRSCSTESVRKTIGAACGEALSISARMSSSGRDLDLAGMLLFIRIVERDVTRALEPRESSHERYTSSRSEVIEPVLAMVRARDEATCQHSLITGDWCRRIAEALGVRSEEVEQIVAAGVLHDIGKIATPDAILFKPGPLDESEWSVMREHAREGSEILLEIPALAEFAPIVRAHHERVDGLGYPDGLRGDEIPFSARVVAVADAYHAMTSDRPYRSALTAGEAISCLQRGRGSQWDAQIVDVMVQLAIEHRNIASDADLCSVDRSADSARPLITLEEERARGA